MGLHFNKRPVRWQRSSPYNNPLLFVIPSEAEGSAVRFTCNQTQMEAPLPLSSRQPGVP